MAKSALNERKGQEQPFLRSERALCTEKRSQFSVRDMREGSPRSGGGLPSPPGAPAPLVWMREE